MLEKIEIWARTQSNGDGSASICWHLTKKEAEWAFENEYEPFSEDGIERVQTFLGSNVYNDAVIDRQEKQKAYFFKDKVWSDQFDTYSDFYNYKLSLEELEEVGMKFLEMTGHPDEWGEDDDE